MLFKDIIFSGKIPSLQFLILCPTSNFIIIWTFVYILHSLRPIEFYTLISIDSSILFLASLFILLLCLLYTPYVPPSQFKALSLILTTPNSRLERYIRTLFRISLVIYTASIIYSRGVPIAWLASGDLFRDYTDFGIPSLHGIGNSCVFQIAACGALLLKRHRRKGLMLCLYPLFVSIIFVSRGVFMVSLAQIICVYIFVSPMRFASMAKIALLTLITLYLFGLFGELRLGDESYFNQLLSPEGQQIFSILPKQFINPYIYLTSGFNNLLYNIQLSPQAEPEFLPFFTLGKLIPSFVNNLFSLDRVVDSFVLANDAFNVSSLLSGFYSDFGGLGFILVSLLICIYTPFFLSLAFNPSITKILCYCYLFQSIVLSIFIDTLFYLPFAFQLVLVYLFYHKRLKFAFN